MPRPTPAQLAYGTATVVFATLAMLLLSEVRSGPGVALITAVGLMLGTLVAATGPTQFKTRWARRRPVHREQQPTVPAVSVVRSTSSTSSAGSNAEPRARQHSLRR